MSTNLTVLAVDDEASRIHEHAVFVPGIDGELRRRSGVQQHLGPQRG